MKNNGILFIWLLAVINITQAQQPSNIDDVLEEILANLTELSDEERLTDVNQLRFELEQLHENPISINRSKMIVFVNIGLITLTQYQALQNHILKYGPLLELQELKRVEGFDSATILRLKPFITFDRFIDYNPRKSFKAGKQDVLLHAERVFPAPIGFGGNQPAYRGTPFRWFLRSTFKINHQLKAGLNLESDAGEGWLWDPNAQKFGVDQISGYVQFSGKGALKKMIIGDFKAGFAQGLSFWKGLAFGKSVNSVPIRKVGSGIRPHSGVDEFNYLRGLGLTLGFKNWESHVFASYRKLDATPINDTVDLGFQTILQSGYHRTPTELNKVGNLSEFLGGVHLNQSHSSFRWGGSGVFQAFNAPLFQGQNLYQRQDFQGRQNFVVGLNMDYKLNNLLFFTEVSMSANAKGASLAGLTLTPDKRLAFSIFHRWFQTGFQPISSNAFGEASSNTNENGVYLGWECAPNKRHRINGYIDFFSFPWLKYGVDAPSDGSEWLVQYTLSPSESWESLIRFRQKTVDKNSPVHPAGTLPKSHQQFRLQTSYSPFENWTFRCRLEYVFIKYPYSSSGQLFYLDILYQPVGKKWSADARLAVFNALEYEARIFAYERDVYYAYSVKPYYGQGQKVYFNMKWKVYRFLTGVFRLEHVIFPFQSTIGNGNNQIAGNQRAGVKLQLRFRW